MIINPHWDKCLRKHNVSDEQLEVIKLLLYDTQKGYDRAMRDNGLLLEHMSRISSELKEFSLSSYVHFAPCKHKWVRTTKNYKSIRKCVECGEIKQNSQLNK